MARPPRDGIGCSSFATAAPLGILSTPVIDATTRTIYVAGATGNASGLDWPDRQRDQHRRPEWSSRGGRSTCPHAASFDPKIHNQRSALSLVNGILYVPYAGYVGDCGSYHGRVVTVNTANPTMVGQWMTSDNGGGIWAPGGLASDGTGVFATTGNAVPFGHAPANHGDTEQVTRITGMGTKADYFYPTNWTTMDRADADFGSVNPMFITVPGATPSKLVVAIAKDGKGYLLDADQLRGTSSGTAAGGQKVMFTLASGDWPSTASRRPTGPRWERTSSSRRTAAPGLPGRRVRSSGHGGENQRRARSGPRLPGARPMATVTTSPIATTTDGTSDAVVWFTSSGTLKGVDGDTGAAVYTGTNSLRGGPEVDVADRGQGPDRRRRATAACAPGASRPP